MTGVPIRVAMTNVAMSVVLFKQAPSYRCRRLVKYSHILAAMVPENIRCEDRTRAVNASCVAEKCGWLESLERPWRTPSRGNLDRVPDGVSTGQIGKSFNRLAGCGTSAIIFLSRTDC